jgi:hypothetical protein
VRPVALGKLPPAVVVPAEAGVRKAWNEAAEEGEDLRVEGQPEHVHRVDGDDAEGDVHGAREGVVAEEVVGGAGDARCEEEEWDAEKEGATGHIKTMVIRSRTFPTREVCSEIVF